MSDHRIEWQIGPDLMVVFDLYEFADSHEPIIGLNFYPTGKSLMMPGFNVGMPLDKWAEFQAMVASYSPVPKAAQH